MTNKLYYGDNLGVLCDHIAGASVDLVFLDPPFNSNAASSVLFKAPVGIHSQAQIEAFDDIRHWTESAETDHRRIPRIQITHIPGSLNFREVPRLPFIDTTPFTKAPKVKQARQGQSGM